MSETTPKASPERIPCKALILAGGSGTRLWPLSRTLLPKQLLALNGELTLLQQTVRRALSRFAPEDLCIVTNEEQVFEVRGQVRDLDPALEERVVAEPVGRNTLPAVLLGMGVLLAEAGDAGQDPDRAMHTPVAVFPSDHLVHEPEAWARALERGAELAREGWFVTFGITPTGPETGYGYIRRGQPLGEDAFEVGGFVEKPDLATAREYVESGEHVWNSGMFVFQPAALLAAVQTHQPELAEWFAARRGRALVAGYDYLPSISVDYGIMERVDRQAVVRGDFGWDDLGSWEALRRLGTKDARGNVVQGDVLDLDCADSLLISRGGKLAAVGLKDVIVVQTRDATLVMPAAEVQRVRDVVDRLKAEDSQLVSAHVTVNRPWGSYTVLEEGAHYKIKRIVVLPGAVLSLQKHHHRSEHWVVISGTAQVLVGEQEMLLTENQSVDIPKTALHRLGNPGKVPVEIIEIQSGPYLREDDIVRFEDVYGRTGSADEKGGND